MAKVVSFKERELAPLDEKVKNFLSQNPNTPLEDAYKAYFLKCATDNFKTPNIDFKKLKIQLLDLTSRLSLKDSTFKKEEYPEIKRIVEEIE